MVRSREVLERISQPVSVTRTLSMMRAPSFSSGRKTGGLDGEHHAALDWSVGGAVHLKAFGPSRREAGCDTVAAGVPPSFFHACIADDLPGGFVGD